MEPGILVTDGRGEQNIAGAQHLKAWETLERAWMGTLVHEGSYPDYRTGTIAVIDQTQIELGIETSRRR
jgi:hypothetical protein